MEHEIPTKQEVRKGACGMDATSADGILLNFFDYNILPTSVGPAICRVQDSEHGAALSALANLRRSRQQLRFATAQPVHRDQHEPPLECLDDLRALERDRVVRQQL